MKKTALIFGLIIILLLAGGILFWKVTKKKEVKPPPPVVEEEIPIEDLLTTNPFGVSLTPRADKKAVILKIATPSADLKTIEYELTYETTEAPQGVLGKIDYQGEKTLEREIILGTCSKNVCRYHTGVKKVTLTLKFIGEKVRKFQGEFPF